MSRDEICLRVNNCEGNFSSFHYYIILILKYFSETCFLGMILTLVYLESSKFQL